MSVHDPTQNSQDTSKSTPPEPYCNLRDAAFLLTGQVGADTCTPESVAARATVVLQLCNDSLKAILRAGVGWNMRTFWRNVFRDLADTWDHPIPPFDVICLVQFILDTRMASRADPDTLVPDSDITRAADELLLNCHCAPSQEKGVPIVDDRVRDLPVEFLGPFYHHYFDVQRAKEGWDAALDEPEKLRLPWELLTKQLIRENSYPS